MRSTKELQFTFITDDRFDESEQSLVEWDRQLKEGIKGKGEITYESFTRVLYFDDPENNHQWRKTYRIRKSDSLTWNDIYELVNSIKVCHFQKVQKEEKGNVKTYREK